MLFARLVTSLFLTVSVFSPAFAQTEAMVEKTYTGTLDEEDPQVVRRKVQADAFEKVSEEVIQELIGVERFNKNKSLIKNKIVKNSSRYIPFTKPSEVKLENGKSTMSLSMKVSLKDLKQLLQSNGLLNDNDSVPIVLPMITIQDKIAGDSYRWWNRKDSGSGFSMKEGRLIESQLKSSFSYNGFHLLSATEGNLGEQVPSEYKSDRPSSEDLEFLSQRFNAPVLLDGTVTVSESENKGQFVIEIKLTAFQVSNARTIADISRRFEASGKSYEAAVDKKLASVFESAANDLAVQIADVWQRGAIGTSIVGITLYGRQNIKALEEFKGKVSGQIPQVKSIRERLISSDAMSYEVDTNLSSRELAAKLNGIVVGNQKLLLEKDSGNEVVLRWNKE